MKLTQIFYHKSPFFHFKILPFLLDDLPMTNRQRSPTPLSSPNMAPGFLPYPNLNPFLLQNLAANYQAGLAGLANQSPISASQQLQNYLFAQSAQNPYLGAAQMAKPVTPVNLPCYDPIPSNMNPFLPGGMPANWMSPGPAFQQALPPNHPFLQVC
jgi:hypothetical protein